MSSNSSKNRQILILGGMPDESRGNIIQMPIMKPQTNPLKQALFGRLFKLSRTRLFINPEIFSLKPDLVILFDSGVTKNLLEQIEKAFPNARLIFFYFNPVALSFDIRLIPRRFEVWSYSAYDCEKYGIKKNTQVLNAHLRKKCEQVALLDVDRLYHAVFVGAEKKRGALLDFFAARLTKIGKPPFFYIVKNHKYSFSRRGKFRRKLSYEDYLLLEHKSDVIIDCTTSEKAGITLRPLEAIILKKKLITNCDELLHSELMNYGNIISISESDESLSAFFEKPFRAPPKETLEYYSFDSWISRFDEAHPNI